MLSTRVFGLACAVAVFVCLVAAPVSAQPLDKRTLFTFNGAVTLPGVTLPAGRYLFRLADPNSSSKVVQVLNADGTTPHVSASAAPTPAAPSGTTQEGTIASSSLSIAIPSIPAIADAPVSAQAPATGASSTSSRSTRTGSARAARTQLPRTASQLPLVAMVGAISLLSAASLRFWRTRSHG